MRMAFRLITIFWVIALFAAAMATFGFAGIMLAGLVLAFWYWIFGGRQGLAGAGALVFLMFILSSMTAVLIPAVRSSPSSHTSQCRNNMKQLALGLHMYWDQYKVLPPPYVADASGKPMHSWRVLLLPFIDRPDLFARYNLSEPWNGPNNSKLAASMPDVFRCPSQAGGPADEAHYFAVVDPQTAWPPGGGCTMLGITDGTSRTMMLIEVPDKSVNWMEPCDLTFDEAVKELTSKARTRHADTNSGLFTSRGSARNVAICDGSVRSFPQILDAEYATALLTAAGGETQFPTLSDSLDDDSPLFSKPQFLWGKVYALAAFALLSLAPVTRLRHRNAATNDGVARVGGNDDAEG
jgi:hypothetical protein